MKRECAFCPAVAELSGEHLWSAWMGKLFPSTKFAFTKKNEAGEAKQWIRPFVDLKAYVVCKRCNETWMSRLESDHAKPAMTDLIMGAKDLTISKAQARSIALFAFKTAVVCDHMHDTNKEPFFLRSRRHRFAKCLALPFNVHVWIAGFVPQGKGHVHTFYYGMNFDSDDHMSLYVCTYAIGHLVFQVAAIQQTRWGAYFPNPVFNLLSIPIRPNFPPYELKWPPPCALMKVADFDAYSERWREVTPAGRR